MRAALPKPLPGLLLAPRGGSTILLVELMILVALAALSYGLFIPWLGYYWDDWRILWIGSSHSTTTILEDYAYRPGTAWLFHALNRFVGTNYPLAHCLALAVRFLCALTLWRIVRLVWPSCPTVAFSAAVLFLVYPGFTQQSISLTYENYHISILLFLISISITMYSIINISSKLYFILILSSVLFQIACFLVLDGLVVWEVMRWALILVLAARCSASSRGALAFGVRQAIPYVLTFISFVLWRGLFVKAATRDEVDVFTVLRSWRSLSFSQIATMIPGQILNNILDSSIFAWSVPAWRGVNYRERVVMAGLCVAAVGASLAYLRLRRWADDEGPKSWARGFILVGSVSLLAISVFQCVTKKNVRLDYHEDRFAYSASAAAVFLVLGLSGSCFGRRATVPLVTLLVGLSTLSNFGNAYTFKRLWSAERSLNWQLAWRAPDIEPGTVVVIARPRQGSWLNDLVWAHDINGPLNLHYTESESPLIGLSLDGIAVDIMELLSEGRRDEAIDLAGSQARGLFDGLPGMRVQEPPGVLLMFLRHPEGTLRVVDADHIEELPDHFQDLTLVQRCVRPLAKCTRVDLIRGSGPVGIPTDQLVGKEPPHTWPWYFQRAELARQLGHYDELSRLAKDVHSKHLTPSDPSEWLIFLEAAIRAGDHDAASWIVLQFQSRHRSFIPKVRTWLDKFLARAEGQEKAFARSIVEGVEGMDDGSRKGGEQASRPDR